MALNPNDNQGIRYLLLGSYLERGAYDEADKLLRKIPEDGTFWAYGRLLSALRRAPDAPATHQLALKAVRQNPYVPLVLARVDRARFDGDTYGEQDVEGALYYDHECGGAWRRDAGALAWLVERTAAEAAAGRAERDEWHQRRNARYAEHGPSMR